MGERLERVSPPNFDAIDWEQLGKEGRGERRPWGGFITLWEKNPPDLSLADLTERVAEKFLYFKPGMRNSYQRHKHRGERWTILQGEAKVCCGERDDAEDITFQRLSSGDKITIPCGILHQIENVGKEVLIIHEEHFGYYDEKDIIRLQDDFGRT